VNNLASMQVTPSQRKVLLYSKETSLTNQIFKLRLKQRRLKFLPAKKSLWISYLDNYTRHIRRNYQAI